MTDTVGSAGAGLVVVDKPAGWTSHDVVARLRRVYGQRRVGHAGTLDPDATGVLLVGLGRMTRLLRFLQEAGKAYEATVAFGTATDTLDASGAIVEREPMAVEEPDVVAASRRFVGDVFQVPPMVSAIKVGGRRLHELAREGKEVDRAPRPVRIDRIDVNSFKPGPFPEAGLFVECGTGTYIRTLAADLGAAMGGCAHLKTLRRVRVGSFRITEASSMDAIEADPPAVLVSPAVAMRDLEAAMIEDAQVQAVAHGATFAAQSLLPTTAGDGPFAILDAEGNLLAVYERRGGGVKPSVVLVAAADAS